MTNLVDDQFVVLDKEFPFCSSSAMQISGGIQGGHPASITFQKQKFQKTRWKQEQW